MPAAETKQQQTQLKLTALIGLIALAAMGMSQGAVSPGLARFAEIWPQYISNIALINTLPSLIAIPASLISGQLADRGYLSYKQLALLGMVIATAGGLAPLALFGSFPMVLICRACFGMGMGLFQPVCTSVVLLLVPGDRARHYLSITSASSSLGGILFQSLGGLLCDVNPRLTFAAYILSGLATILVLLFLPNPPRAKVLPKKVKEAKKEPLGHRVFGWAVLNMLFSGGFFILTNTISMVVINNGLGTAAQAANALSLFTLGAFFGSLLSSRVYKLLRAYTLPLACLIPAVGYLILILAGQIGIIYAGTFLFGIGFGFWNPCLQAFAGRSVPVSNTSTALSITMCFAGIGNFFSAYVVNFVAGFFPAWDRFGFAFGSILFLVMAVILVVYCLKYHRHRT